MSSNYFHQHNPKKINNTNSERGTKAKNDFVPMRKKCSAFARIPTRNEEVSGAGNLIAAHGPERRPMGAKRATRRAPWLARIRVTTSRPANHAHCAQFLPKRGKKSLFQSRQSKMKKCQRFCGFLRCFSRPLGVEGRVEESFSRRVLLSSSALFEASAPPMYTVPDSRNPSPS